ncbi:OmpA family protein [Paludibacterium yongneupense]|uniref:OmpA family protein n=1 Tax=Paludibacterium yongneupense TaxID=400061 RepID=UPI00042430B3|nr:OmpA family protein [Paludibacterium yongneupense]
MKRPSLFAAVFRRARPALSSLLVFALVACSCVPSRQQSDALALQQRQIEQDAAQIARLQARLQSLGAQQPPPEARLCLIAFRSGRATLSADAFRTLRLMASELKRHPEFMISINGYSDNIGDEGGNTDLSQRRANSVERVLIDGGVPAGHLNTHAFGSENPVAVNSSAAGRRHNRRVECVLRQTENSTGP